MDQRELIEYIGQRKQENLDTIRRKNADYATETDPFWNFRLCEVLGICSTEEGLLVRILDKYARIINQIVYGKSYAVEEEDIHNTLGDSSNYCDLLDAYLVAKERGQLMPLPRLVDYPTNSNYANDWCPTNSNYAKERTDAAVEPNEKTAMPAKD